ncbi:hypothetical protein [Pandoraea pulmonicola]|uniref:Uncharacterized protein n=1 Tax=Pandoraea pulmonicola TaxID=93221 RepID=A0AAJ4ZBA4_PANPU|nr:hypothetical protein [Pandoraea pulmonicola]SUA90076.1 Uncharacterised protein [Pandoraea pulmonicola]
MKTPAQLSSAYFHPYSRVQDTSADSSTQAWWADLDGVCSQNLRPVVDYPFDSTQNSRWMASLGFDPGPGFDAPVLPQVAGQSTAAVHSPPANWGANIVYVGGQAQQSSAAPQQYLPLLSASDVEACLGIEPDSGPTAQVQNPGGSPASTAAHAQPNDGSSSTRIIRPRGKTLPHKHARPWIHNKYTEELIQKAMEVRKNNFALGKDRKVYGKELEPLANEYDVSAFMLQRLVYANGDRNNIWEHLSKEVVAKASHTIRPLTPVVLAEIAAYVKQLEHDDFLKSGGLRNVAMQFSVMHVTLAKAMSDYGELTFFGNGLLRQIANPPLHALTPKVLREIVNFVEKKKACGKPIEPKHPWLSEIFSVSFRALYKCLYPDGSLKAEGYKFLNKKSQPARFRRQATRSDSVSQGVSPPVPSSMPSIGRTGS